MTGEAAKQRRKAARAHLQRMVAGSATCTADGESVLGSSDEVLADPLMVPLTAETEARSSAQSRLDKRCGKASKERRAERRVYLQMDMMERDIVCEQRIGTSLFPSHTSSVSEVSAAVPMTHGIHFDRHGVALLELPSTIQVSMDEAVVRDVCGAEGAITVTLCEEDKREDCCTQVKKIAANEIHPQPQGPTESSDAADFRMTAIGQIVKAEAPLLSESEHEMAAQQPPDQQSISIGSKEHCVEGCAHLAASIPEDDDPLASSRLSVSTAASISDLSPRAEVQS